MSNRKHVEALKQACQDAGWVVEEILRGGKHYSIAVQAQTPDGVVHRRKFAAPCTPSCHRGMLNFRTDCRRVLRVLAG
jgi:hypothetical protein